jgi:hypothetical protein
VPLLVYQCRGGKSSAARFSPFKIHLPPAAEEAAEKGRLERLLKKADSYQDIALAISQDR